MENHGFEEKLKSETRLRAMEERLARLERALNLNRPAQPLPPAQQAVPAPVLQPAALAPVLAKPRHSSWLGAVAVICFVLAAGFIIKLSLDSGWLTPERQVGLAAMLGFALIVAGLALQGADREYAGFLPAAGIIVLYACAFSAHRIYSLIPFESAVSLVCLVSGLCIWLYTRIHEDLYPVTAAVGSYLGPVILGLNSASVFSVYYYLLCSIAFSVISIWVRSRILTLVAAYLAIMMTAFTGLALHADKLIVAMLALNFLVISGGTYLYTCQHAAPLTESESAGFLPVLLFFYAMEYYFVERIAPGLAPWLSLGFAGLLLALYLGAKKRFPEGKMGSESMILAFISVVCFHSFYMELLPAGARPWLFGAIILALCAPGMPLRGQGGALRIPALAVMAVLLLEYLSMASHMLTSDAPSWLLVSMFSMASLWTLIYFRGEEFSGRGNYLPLLAAAHLLAIVGFYKITRDNGSLQVSASWLLYALGVIAFSFSRRDAVMARSAVFVLAFAAGKALLYDAAAAPTIVRILCLLLTGAALYGAGFFLRKISAWNTVRPV